MADDWKVKAFVTLLKLILNKPPWLLTDNTSWPVVVAPVRVAVHLVRLTLSTSEIVVSGVANTKGVPSVNLLFGLLNEIVGPSKSTIGASFTSRIWIVVFTGGEESPLTSVHTIETRLSGEVVGFSASFL